MKDKLEALLSQAVEELAGISTGEALHEVRVRFLGRKGDLTALMKGIGALQPEERPLMGQVVNEIRDKLDDKFDTALINIRAARKAQKLKEERIDVTLPGRRIALGTKHPITL